MKFIIVFALCFVAAMAAPADVEVVKSAFVNDGNTYNFAFEQSDGQSRSETGEVTNLGKENEAIAVRGSFSFIGDDKQTYTVTYIADENGFQPSAPHLPVAPVA